LSRESSNSDELEELPTLITDDMDLPDKLEVIILGKRTAKHYEYAYNNEKDWKVKIEGNEYKIPKEAVLKGKKGMFERCREKYVIFYKEGEEEPLTLSIDEPPMHLSSKILYIALKSENLSKGLSSIFRGVFSLPLSFKSLAYILIFVGVIGGLVYMILNGMIAL